MLVKLNEAKTKGCLESLVKKRKFMHYFEGYVRKQILLHSNLKLDLVFVKVFPERSGIHCCGLDSRYNWQVLLNRYEGSQTS
jgi:hypothetical protein